MSLSHTASAPGVIPQTVTFGRAARRLFGVLFRKLSSAADRFLVSGHEIPPEVLRFPPF